MLPAGYSLGDEDLLSIGRMRVALWPEYDDPGVLVIYDGRFTNPSRFPTKTRFILPKGSVINDACSLSPKGQHFCQLYKIVNKGEFDEIVLTLPFPNFYLSFHTSPFNTRTENRDFDYSIKINHPIEVVEVDIQQPLRSTEFKISPSDGNASTAKGFNHFKYTFHRVSRGDEKKFKVNYIKQDHLPSVDIKYSGMSGPRVWGSPYDTQRKVKTLIYIMFATGVLGMMVAIIWFLRRKTKN